MDETRAYFAALTHEQIEANYAPGGDWYGWGCKIEECNTPTSPLGWYRTVPTQASDIYCHACAHALAAELNVRIERVPNAAPAQPTHWGEDPWCLANVGLN